MDRMGVLSYRVWYFASLRYDEDQRDNEINARRQQVQILFAREHRPSAWFNPELLAIPLDGPPVDGINTGAGVYRFAIETLFHEQEHVLDEQGEHLLSYAGSLGSVSHDSYAAAVHGGHEGPDDQLSTGGER